MAVINPFFEGAFRRNEKQRLFIVNRSCLLTMLVNESSFGFIFSPQVENLQAYKFEHLYQQVADIALSTLLPKADQAKTGLAETDSKLSPLKVGHNWTTQKPKLDFDC
ncbi:hypothetical protein [Limosilactobacillus mucosae]|uniref:hypothetical protein n=1 Tax=Limosilactobacillus mucosae TaxID=97478 RepID=UPI001F56D9AB|nr:hypothetical protein [Limosilactobacillus mucosae]UNL61133.1 hypothetical protein G8B17_01830 [Limosilactobacillus mucosae]